MIITGVWGVSLSFAPVRAGEFILVRDEKGAGSRD